MNFDFEKTRRTVWEVTDRTEFFMKMQAILNIDKNDAQEIAKHLTEPDFDYVEVASYLPGSTKEDPDAVLVFDSKKDVYWDIFNIKKTKAIIDTIQTLAGDTATLTHKRGLTQRDWRKRFQALSQS